MKKNSSFILILFAFLLLMGGAYVLYGNLSQGAAPDQLAVIYGQDSEHTETPEGNVMEPAETVHAVENTEDTNTADAVENTEDANTADDSRNTSDAERTMAPDFTVYDLAGNEILLSDHFGKPIVLNFWASWCGPCQSEMPDFDEAYAELGEDIQFMMVNLTTGRETLDSASSFIEENGYSFPVFYDTDLEAASAYGAYSLPTTYFIDSNGYVIAQAVGAINRETLQRGIEMIIAE